MTRGVGQKWWASPTLHRAVFEATLLVASWRLYRFGRYLVRDQEASAFQHAEQIRWLQGAFGLDLEAPVQQLVLAQGRLIELINGYYAYVHFPLTIGCLAWLFTRDVERYLLVRRALLGAMTVGLALHASYPLAPPRMLTGMEMVDTLATYGPRVYSANHFSSVTNQYAAMPSFHVGWSVLVAWVVVTTVHSHRRWLVVLHPMVTLLAVTATGNHFLVDGIVGAALILAALRVSAWAANRSIDRPIAGLVGLSRSAA